MTTFREDILAFIIYVRALFENLKHCSLCVLHYRMISILGLGHGLGSFDILGFILNMVD